jgi:hypothetical protein
MVVRTPAFEAIAKQLSNGFVIPIFLFSPVEIAKSPFIRNRASVLLSNYFINEPSRMVRTIAIMR